MPVGKSKTFCFHDKLNAIFRKGITACVYLPHPETQVQRLNFRKHGASFLLNDICGVIVKAVVLSVVHAKMDSASPSREA